MAEKQSVEVEVNYRPKGLGELKAKWSDFAGDLLEPVVMLAAGATKAQAAWAGMRGVLESRVLGPLGLVAGASIGFLATTKLLVGQWRALGMTAAGALERMSLEFRPLLGSLDRAKERIKELSTFAVKTPFELGEIVEANKMLEVLTQGALATEKGMTLVGDAASVANVALSDTARYVGRLYDGLLSGRPVGEAAMRLQEMGIISGKVRNQIESMQASNQSGLEIWRVVEKQLERNTGAMAEQSKGLEGLQSTWNDTKRQMEGGFSKGFLDGEKAGVEASTKVMEAMTPVMTRLGDELGAGENAWAKWKLGVVKAVTSGAGFAATVEWLIKGAVGLAAILAGASTAAIAGFTINLLKLIAGNKAAANSTAHLAAIESASIPAKTKLVAIKNALAAASRANAAGLRSEATANLTAAAAGLKNLASTNGLVGAVSVGKRAMTGFGLAVRFVGLQLRAMAVAMLANPLVWVAAAVIGLVAAFSKLAAVQRENRERLESYQRATAALDTGMKKQIADIRTLVDLRQAESRILTELVGAYRAVEGAKNGADKTAAEQRVNILKASLKGLPDTRGLEKSEAQLALEKGEKLGARAVKESGRDAIAAKGPEEALAVAEERLNEIINLRKQAYDLMNEEAAAEERAAAARQAAVGSEGERQQLLAKQAKLAEDLARQKSDANKYESMEGEDTWGRKDRLAKIKLTEEALAKVKAKVEEISNTGDGGGLSAMLGSPSELQRIKAKIAVLDQLAAATTDEERARAEKLAEQGGVAGISPAARQALVTRRDELEERRGQDTDPMAVVEASKARKDAELAVATARLDAEAGVASLRLRGFEREEKLLAIEREKLALKLKVDVIGQGQYDREESLLREREAALQKEGMERRDELASAYAVSRLRRAEAEAERSGDPAKAAQMRIAADAVEDARARKEAEREAAEAAATPQERSRYVADKVKESQDARAAERKRAEEERSEGRGRSQANQGSATAAIRAEQLRLTGKTKEARKVTEDAARQQDELDRKEKQRAYREQGFTGKQADIMADRDVKTSQAGRLMEELTGKQGSVVATGLAKIGGGGNVTGTDPDTRQLERIGKLLEQILNETKKDVDREMER